MPPANLTDKEASNTARSSSSPGVAALDFGKLLADSDRGGFRVLGTCMYPCLQTGDLLHVASRTVEEAAVGEIAVCRGRDCLFGHRVIRKGVVDGRSYLVTRPDRAEHGEDDPTFDENLLGVVTSVERNGRPVDAHAQSYRWPKRLYLAARLHWIEGFPAVTFLRFPTLEFLQRNAVYRRLARFWLALARPKLSYGIQLPFQSGSLHNLFQLQAVDEFDLRQPAWQGLPVSRWTLALRLGSSRQPAAWATFVLPDPSGSPLDWQVEELQVRARYWGFGLEERLYEQAAPIFARSGARLDRRRL